MKNVSRHVMAGACFILAVGMTLMIVPMLFWSFSGTSPERSVGAVIWALIALPAVIYISMRVWRALRGQETLTKFEPDPSKKEPIQLPETTRGK